MESEILADGIFVFCKMLKISTMQKWYFHSGNAIPLLYFF